MIEKHPFMNTGAIGTNEVALFTDPSVFERLRLTTNCTDSYCHFFDRIVGG